MKRTCLVALLCLITGLVAIAQIRPITPTLHEDNIEEVLSAMTVEEKVSLLVGGAGNDLMEWGNQIEIDRLMAAVNSGEISQEELDRNVRNLLNH